MLKNLQPFMETDGAETGAQTIKTEEQARQNDNNATDHNIGADEPKTGIDIKSEAQKLADGMLAKKMKNMPSKEELAAFRKWQDEQKSEAQRIADVQRKAEDAILSAEKREAKANAMIAAASNGIKSEHIEDAVILAMARVDDDTTIEEEIEKIARANPAWKAGTAELPKDGSNPAANADSKLFEIKKYF